MIDFHVGQRVVCIKDDWDWSATYGEYSVPVRLPMIDEVLTVKTVEYGVDSLRDKVGLIFFEIDEVQADGPLSARQLWGAHCFRPLIERKTDIAILKAMLTPSRVEVDA